MIAPPGKTADKPQLMVEILITFTSMLLAVLGHELFGKYKAPAHVDTATRMDTTAEPDDGDNDRECGRLAKSPASSVQSPRGVTLGSDQHARTAGVFSDAHSSCLLPMHHVMVPNSLRTPM